MIDNLSRAAAQSCQGYFPVTADRRARGRRQRLSKLIARPALREHVIAGLSRAWSPQQIAGRLAFENNDLGRVSHETIYRYAYSDDSRAQGLGRLLSKARKRRRPRFGRKPRKSFVPVDRGIAHRLLSVGKREEFGHWEGDLMIFRRHLGKTNIATIIERQTRFTLLLRNADRHAEPIADGITTGMQSLPTKARSPARPHRLFLRSSQPQAKRQRRKRQRTRPPLFASRD